MKKSLISVALLSAGWISIPEAVAVDLSPSLVLRSKAGAPYASTSFLVDLEGVSPEAVRVRNASSDDYEDAGYEKGEFAQSVQVSLLSKSDRFGYKYVQLKSSKPAPSKAQYVLVIIDWPGGRSQREFLIGGSAKAIQVDDATDDDQQSGAGRAVVAQRARPPSNGEPPEVPLRDESTAQGAPASAKDITVQAGMTASGLAKIHKPKQMTTASFYAALLRDNPHAFDGSNINRIKSGALIRLRSAEPATSIQRAPVEIEASATELGRFRQAAAQSARQVPEEGSEPLKGRLAKSGESVTEPQSDKLRLSKGQVLAQDQALLAAHQSASSQARAVELRRRLAEIESELASITKSSKSQPAGGGEPRLEGRSSNGAKRLPAVNATAPSPNVEAVTLTNAPTLQEPAPTESPGIVQQLMKAADDPVGALISAVTSVYGLIGLAVLGALMTLVAIGKRVQLWRAGRRVIRIDERPARSRRQQERSSEPEPEAGSSSQDFDGSDRHVDSSFDGHPANDPVLRAAAETDHAPHEDAVLAGWIEPEHREEERLGIAARVKNFLAR